VTTLDHIADDPSEAEKMSTGDATILLARLAVVQSVLTTRLLTIMVDGQKQPAGNEPDRLLTVPQAAQQLGLSADWLYRHADRLPFTVRVGVRRLRFSAQGVDRYIRERARNRDSV
jgi:excisionase family DNA binding protein